MRFLIILVVSIIVFIPGIGFSQTTWYVDGTNASGPWLGTQADPFQFIQEGIDAAFNGDTVLVLPFTYVENIDFKGKAITLTSEQGADVTVIDGNQNGSVVLFNSGEGSDSVLDGFTITNGSGTWTVDPYFSGYAGGGINCRNNASPSIMGNIISKNSAGVNGGGGGIYSWDSSPTISNNLISQNTAWFCGGVYCGQQTPTVTNNIITKNTATSYGGGMYCLGTTAVVVGNDISDNAAYYGGGGVWITAGDASTFTNNMISDNSVSESGGLGGGMGIAYQSIPIIKNSILSGNSSAGAGGAITLFEGSNSTITNNSIYGNIALYGGGVHVLQNSTPTFINNTICANTAKNNGGGMRIDTDCNVVVTNSIFWGNQLSTGTQGPEIIIASASELTIDYSDAEGGQASVHVYPGSTLNWGSGMIDSDPLFVDPDNGDFHLTFNSPCRASGNNSAVPPWLVEDFEGDGRCCYGTVDMGADEFYTHLYYTGDSTPGGNVEIKFVGLPGTSPVGLCIGTGVLDPPIPSMWGDWYLKFPIIGPVDLGSITSPEGVLIIPGVIPATPPPPYSIPMQALIGAELTNLSVMEVK